MMRFRSAAWLFSAGALLLSVSVSISYAQTYPSKPIRIVTGEAGGSNDFAARQIALGASASLGQPVIVENRTAIIAADNVSVAQPDGYTLLYAGTPLWISPLLRKTTYDLVKDFATITQVMTAPNVLAVHPAVPAKSVKELIALAKAKPGALNYSSSGVGTSNHLAVELLKSMAGVNIVHIPYKGGGPALIALLGNEVQLSFITAGSTAPYLKSEKLRILAVGSAEPFALIPSLPTIAASGLPGYESATVQGMFAPAKTPVSIIRRLNRDIVQALNRAEVKERFLNGGGEVVAGTPEAFMAKIKSEVTRLGKVIRDNGIRE